MPSPISATPSLQLVVWRLGAVETSRRGDQAMDGWVTIRGVTIDVWLNVMSEYDVPILCHKTRVISQDVPRSHNYVSNISVCPNPFFLQISFPPQEIGKLGATHLEFCCSRRGEIQNDAQLLKLETPSALLGP